MPADSRPETPKASRAQRSFGGKVLFAAGLIFVLATTLLGAFACVALLLRLGDTPPLSSVVPEDGQGALVIGGIGVGGISGLLLPTVLFGMVRGNEDTPRVGAGAAGRKLLALLVFDVCLLIVAFAVSLLGSFLPQPLTTFVAVLAVGFSWVPAALAPWEKIGLRGVTGRPPSPRRPGSDQPD
ncbi:hypothetical protein [Streptomyces sp. NPDC002328]|uniref:hypothetical protein n=1 Tax=Streptomyces sp. NPDC002328 TaxID=3364642 RepID=UPI0036804E6B